MDKRKNIACATDGLYRKTLFIVIVLAFLLRLPGIAWGLRTFEPYGVPHSFHPDEPKIVLGVRGYPKDMVTRTDFRYPTGLHYLLGILTLPLRLFKDALPAPLDIDIYYIVGRFFVALTGILAVALTYQLGAKNLSPPVGLLAASILAVSLYHVRNSALITTDVPTSALMVLAVLIALEVNSGSSFSVYAWLGATIGLLVGTKYTGAFGIIPVGIILLERFVHEPDWVKRRKMLGMIGGSVFVSMIVFVITTPGIILSFPSFRESLSDEFARIGETKSSLFKYQTWTYLFDMLAGSSNFLIAIFSILGLIAGLWKNVRLSLIPYITLIFLYLAYFSTSLLQRYVITIMPFLCLLCAHFLMVFLQSKATYIRIAGVFGIVSLLSFGLFQSIALNYFLQTDSRYQVAEYIYKEIPAGSTIAMGLDSTKPSCYFNPRADQSVVSIDQGPDYLFLCGGESLRSENGQIMIKTLDNPHAAQYQLVAEFKEKYPVVVEFVYPTVRIYRKEN